LSLRYWKIPPKYVIVPKAYSILQTPRGRVERIPPAFGKGMAEAPHLEKE
jgi:hypothetical protein